MRRKMLNISLGFVISIMMTFSATQQVLAQCNWSTKISLPPVYATAAVPGLTASNDRLILTFPRALDSTFVSLISFDGINWSNPVARSDFPRIAGGYRGGLGMTYSSACGYVYASWRDGSNNMWATRSIDGINWEAPRLIVSATVLSAPALRGDNGSLPIGFAFSRPGIFSGQFRGAKGKFNCDFSNVVFPIQDGFFNGTSTEPASEPTMPAWTGALGTTELSAVATGPPIMGRVAQIIYQVNSDIPQSAGANWSNNGLAGTVNPNDGTPYIAWTCHPDILDTCSPESTAKINIRNLKTGGHMGCADWSMFNPAVTFFKGKIWIAWRAGGTLLGTINVASLDPF